MFSIFFFFNDTATTEIYTLSLHDALPIWNTSARKTIRETKTRRRSLNSFLWPQRNEFSNLEFGAQDERSTRSEEHTSELQSQSNLVCRLLLEKKNKLHTIKIYIIHNYRQL